MKDHDRSDFDFIGDIHGHHGKLVSLLDKLGYRPAGGSRRHPAGRRVVFLGDFIDRGPAARAVLHTVRGMVEAGEALAVMGNHEYNAICYATPDGAGGFLRPRVGKNIEQHAPTLRDFAGRDREWSEWIEWFKRLPLFLDCGGFRAVHACWDERAVSLLRGVSLADPEILRESRRSGSPVKRAVDHCLSGPELRLPEGRWFVDKEGVRRPNIRARWWDVRRDETYGEVCMPESFDCPVPLRADHFARLPSYASDAPPACFGHYWLSETWPRQPLRHNLVCLDYSAGRGGPLVACRRRGDAPRDWEFVESN